MSDELEKDITQIMTDNSENATPFMKLFWDEQRKLSSVSAKQRRYHPMIIRYCLSLLSDSSAAYDKLRKSSLLVLPSRRVLSDYKNAIRPRRGFNYEIINELKVQTEGFLDVQRYVTLAFDEMKVQSGLVWDKNTGELIGYIDLGDSNLNYMCLQEGDDLASHALVIYERGLANDLKFPLANFATGGVTSSQLVPIFWKAVSVLELTCNLWVVAASCDGAAPNRKFFNLHYGLVGETLSGVIHRTLNLYATQRFIYFFADAPHLLKTARNCLYHSGAASNHSRYMWKDGYYLVWQHIFDIYNKDQDTGLHLLPRLTFDHVKLNSYSVMRVNLAAQILSSTVASVLGAYGGPDSQETAKFCSMLDSFFDCANVRNKTEGDRSRKPFLKPYKTLDDERFPGADPGSFSDRFAKHEGVWGRSPQKNFP